MDKVPRRYNKVNKEEKLNKRSMKSKEKCGKSKFEQLLLDIKNSKNLPRTGQNPGKITSGRITVKSGLFSHAERSDIVFRNDKSKLNEESQAILNEDLLKIIDLANPRKSSLNDGRITKSRNDSVDAHVLNQFSNNLCLEDISPVTESQDFSDVVDCVSDEKSLFKNINEKYEQLMKDNAKSDSNENYMDLEDADLEKFVESRMEQSDQGDIWESHSKEVLEHKRIKDFELSTIKTIVQEQNHIVQDCITNDIASNYKDTPVTNTIKRKFIKRFNEMTLVNNGCQSEAHCSSTDDGLKHQPQGCSTPIKDAIFPETSYHTPENQKYVYKVPDSEIYQTVLYVAPEDHQNNLKQKVSQKENFVEVIVPRSVSSQTGLYEISTKESKDFVFSPKVETIKSRNPFDNLENSDKNVMSKWMNRLKHVYDCGPKKDNIQLGENTVINLRKNLLFEDCDNVLSRPKKIIKRNRSSDVSLKNISSSPFSKFLNVSDGNCSISKSEIRRKLNYSNDLSFDGEHFETIETNENVKTFPTSLFSEVGETSQTNFQFAKPKAYFDMGENSKKHKIEYDCKYCMKNKENSERAYKSHFIPSSPQFNEIGEPVIIPKSPKYEYKNPKQFLTEISESTKPTSEHQFGPAKHYSPVKSRQNRFIERPVKSPKKHGSFKLEIKGLSNPSTSDNFDWKPFEDFQNEKDRFKSLVVEPSSPSRANSNMLASRSRSPFTVSNTNINYSPGDKRKCCPHCLRSPKRNKLQVVPLSPSEYMLRKKVLPHTITSDMKPKNIPDSPVFRLF